MAGLSFPTLRLFREITWCAYTSFPLARCVRTLQAVTHPERELGGICAADRGSRSTRRVGPASAGCCTPNGRRGQGCQLVFASGKEFLGKKTNKVVFKNNHGKLTLKDAKLWPELVVHWGTRLFWLSEGHAGPSGEAVLLLRTSCRLRV